MYHFFLLDFIWRYDVGKVLHLCMFRAFKVAGTQRRVEIVERILLEEGRMKKRKEVYPFLWPDSKKDSARVSCSIRLLMMLNFLVNYFFASEDVCSEMNIRFCYTSCFRCQKP